MSGNHPRFDQIYERNHRSIWAYCLRRTTPEDAYAAANEVFEVAWKRGSDMPDGERTLPWLYGVARKVLSHQRRSANRFSRLTSKAARHAAPHQPQPDQVVVQRLEYEMV